MFAERYYGQKILFRLVSNAGGGGTIVAFGLRSGQVFHEFRTAYTTITAEKSKVAFQSIVQVKIV